MIVFANKWRGVVEKLIEDDADAVDVDSIGVRSIADHLGRNILHGAAERIPFLEAGPQVVPAESEIADFHVVALIEQDVL